MRLIPLLLAPLALLPGREASRPAQEQAKEEAVAKEFPKLRGYWIKDSAETKDGSERWHTEKFTVRENGSAILVRGHGFIDGAVSINPTASPKTLDLRFKEDGMEHVLKCIYDLHGEKLRLCFLSEGTRRPDRFPGTDKGEEGLQLIKFKRLKAVK